MRAHSLCRDHCGDAVRKPFYDTAVASLTRSRQLLEALHPRHQKMAVHLREYANVVSWSQVASPPSLQPDPVPPPDGLQNMFSFEALVAVSEFPLA